MPGRSINLSVIEISRVYMMMAMKGCSCGPALLKLTVRALPEDIDRLINFVTSVLLVNMYQLPTQ